MSSLAVASPLKELRFEACQWAVDAVVSFSSSPGLLWLWMDSTGVIDLATSCCGAQFSHSLPGDTVDAKGVPTTVICIKCERRPPSGLLHCLEQPKPTLEPTPDPRVAAAREAKLYECLLRWMDEHVADPLERSLAAGILASELYTRWHEHISPLMDHEHTQKLFGPKDREWEERVFEAIALASDEASVTY